jgi:hypothetical protein
MGVITNIDEIRDRSWYFTDDCYEYINYNRVLKWPNPCFEYYSAINDRILEDNKIKIEIRKWIEQNANRTVITRMVNKSYRVYYGDKPGSNTNLPYDMWEKSYDVKRIWMQFWFEEEDSALAFRLRFSDMITKMTERDEEHLDKITENRRY